MSIVTRKFRLTPPLDGQTINLGNYPFKDGEISITAPEDEIKLHAQFLERNWQVEAVADDPAAAVKPKANAIEPDKASGDKVALDKIKAALTSLDPKNDEHWTQDGKPAVAVVAQLAGVPNLKRADLEKNFTEVERNVEK